MSDYDETKRDPEKMILNHMGVDEKELGLNTSVLYAHIDDGTWTYIVSVLRMHTTSRETGWEGYHSITRYILHEVDDLWTYKLLDEHTFTEDDIWDGTFDYIDDENEEAGHITWDRSEDPLADPTIIPDKPYTKPKGNGNGE